jgi:hypothetical protein
VVPEVNEFGQQVGGVIEGGWAPKARPARVALFSVTDAEWPAVKAAHEQWLDPANFDAEGRQRLRLSGLTGTTT